MIKREKRPPGRWLPANVVEGLFKTLSLMPLVLPAMLAAFGVVAITLLLFGQLRNELVWPSGLTAAVGAAIAVARYGNVERPGSRIEQRTCDVLVIAGVVVWACLGMAYSAQHVFTDRDPATYAMAGAWLVENETVAIDMPDPLQGLPGATVSSAGFDRLRESNESVIYPQGVHLLPTLLGLGGRIVGVEGMLMLNVLFGATAILAVYGFGRMLVRPRWATVVSAAFAATLPLIYFSRDTYTEPLTATFVFGALALLWAAQVSKRPALWFLAGLVAGASVLVRIDGYLILIGLAVFLAIYMVLAKQGERKQAGRNAGLMAAGMALTGLLGWLDVAWLSPVYYSSLGEDVLLQIAAIGAVVAVGIVMTVLGWKTGLLRRLDAVTRRWRGPAAAILVLLVVGALASRPLWYVSYVDEPREYITIQQVAAGHPVEPRNYTEQSVNWVVWYVGPFIAVLGAAGLAIASYRAMRRRNLLLIASLVVVFISFFYLVRPGIAVDQVWAARRFLPVLIPGLAVFAAVALERLSKVQPRRLLGADGNVVAAVLATLAVISPLIISANFLFVRPLAQLPRAYDICAALPERPIVLWVGEARAQALMPTRTFCDVPVLGYGGAVFNHSAPSTRYMQQFAAKAEAQGLVPVVGLYGHQTSLLDRTEDPQLSTAHVSTIKDLERPIFRPPHQTLKREVSVLFGQVTQDGTIVPLAVEQE